MSHTTAVYCFAAALLGGGLFAVHTAASAQDFPRRPPLDPLAEAKARQSIADQKAEAEVLAAIRDAERLVRTNPAKAVQTLKAAQVNIIDLSPALSGEARRNLTELLGRKIAALEGRLPANPGVKNDPAAADIRRDKSAAFDAYLAEVKAVREGIDRVARLKQAGLNADAELEIARLAKFYPNNPAVIVLQEKGALANRVQESADFARLQSQRVTLALNDVMRSSLPPAGDIEFPKDWKEKTARRLKQVELSDREKKLIEALDKPVTVDWVNRPFDEALQELSNVLDERLFLDKKSIEDLGIDLRRPMTLKANGLAARTVLRQILAAQGLTFVIKDEVIQVVDVEKAKNMLVTRVYYLGDIVQGTGPFGDATRWGPFLDFQQTLANVDALLATIRRSIDPLSWKENGGPASITFHVPSMSIIVRASAEVHATLSAKMGGR